MKRTLITLTILFMTVGSVYAQETNANTSTQWYEVIGGILAIPATIIGIVYSIALIKQTKLESEKAKLEIEEKRKSLSEELKSNSNNSQLLIEPIIQANQIQLIILRFILLEVTLSLWSLINSAYNLVTLGGFIGIQTINNEIANGKFVQFILFCITKLPEIAEWAIIIGIGLPLFKDVSKILGIDLKELLMPWRNRKK